MPCFTTHPRRTVLHPTRTLVARSVLTYAYDPTGYLRTRATCLMESAPGFTTPPRFSFVLRSGGVLY
eukprot:1060549-Rhodomonas_salina.2